ncbi:MAG: 5-oxoprolinase [Epsilonproteobacteria bacterium]|nr:5-oxoprolinase [Campylobacterota bacterium]
MQTVDFAIDRGGTFTDLIARYGERVIVKKVLSQSDQYAESCGYAIGEVLAELFGEAHRFDASKIGEVRMGTTIATNALLERKGEPVALALTKGFEDLLKIGDQSRPDLFALTIQKPEPLTDEIAAIDARVYLRDGKFRVEKEIDERQVRLALGRLKSRRLLISLMHGYGYVEHEKRVAAIAESMGFEAVCAHEISPIPGYLARTETALIDAYLTPALKRYLEDFFAPFGEAMRHKVRLMRSDGTLCTPEAFVGSRALLSGPAGGVAALKSLYEGRPIIGFDMGGTSTDVSRFDGKIALSHESETAGMRVRVPQVQLHTVASGGGSRLFFEDGLLKVGPESSGADPGPLCYGLGGFLSVTDANLVTGRLDPTRFPRIFGPGRDAPLSLETAREGFAPIAEALGQSIEETAEAFLAVADEQMATAIKEVTLKKGFDPKDHVLCAFGGAGGQHAVSVAARLGIKEVLIPRHAGILSAWGMAAAEVSCDAQALVQKPLELCDESLFESLEAKLADCKERGEARTAYLASLKYEGTETALEVPFEGAKEAFEAGFLREFGFLMPERRLVVESIRLVKTFAHAPWSREKIGTEQRPPAELCRLFIRGAWQEAMRYDLRRPVAGFEAVGPALISLETSTVVVPPGVRAVMDERGDLRLFLPDSDDVRDATKSEAGRLALMANRVGFVASRMGAMLRKSAVSTNIKERLDYSCAVFDAKGNLIASAPHIPVHLGSMSSVVKALVAQIKPKEGEQYLTNVPWEGGSHLPDMTVVAPYVKEGRVRFWVASRGHHADIGGSVPGSMPPFAVSIEEEGARFEHFKLIEADRFDEEGVRAVLEAAGARRIEDNLSDLRAQTAANREGLTALAALAEVEGWEALERYMRRIQEVSAEAVRAFLLQKGAGEAEGADRLDNGAEIRLRVRIDAKGGALFDFGGSSPQLFGNQNTPPAVVRSALVYALRVMIGRDLPLNDGLLGPVTLRLPENSLLNPSPQAAVAGGNITTSQRIVDLVLGLFGTASAGQGCMNNVIFGNEDFGYYETIGGGAGATSKADGADAVHTHMTNTRITDAEIFERRYPAAIERFAVRKGSGGEGRHKGGDGIVRAYRFFAPLKVAVISERRVFAPFGLNGGAAGARGRNILLRGEEAFLLEGKCALRVQEGDRLIIETPGGGGWGLVQ